MNTLQAPPRRGFCVSRPSLESLLKLKNFFSGRAIEARPEKSRPATTILDVSVPDREGQRHGLSPVLYLVIVSETVPAYCHPMTTEWHTYQEAADLLGIKPQSVKKRAIRRHWPRMTGNDGLARIQLPDEALPPAPGPVPADIPGDISLPVDDTGERLRAELAATREALARAEGENAANRDRITDLTTDRDALRDALARAAASHPEIVRPVDRGGVAGLWARLRGRG